MLGRARVVRAAARRSFEAQFEGFVSCDRHEKICESADKNVNVVMFHDIGWPYGASKIGVTTPTAGKESGLVVDTDVEINAQNYTFTSGPRARCPPRCASC